MKRLGKFADADGDDRLMPHTAATFHPKPFLEESARGRTWPPAKLVHREVEASSVTFVQLEAVFAAIGKLDNKCRVLHPSS
jgi:hypothetical protein